RFYFFQPTCIGVKAVGATAHGKRFHLGLKRNFFLITIGTSTHDAAMACHPFLAAGRQMKTQIEIATAGRKLAQGSDRHRVVHAGSVQRTKQTATGMSCCAKYESQRRWLSCSRSPGPFTSIMR